MSRRSPAIPKVAVQDPQSLQWYGRTWTPWLPFYVLVDRKGKLKLDWLSPEWVNGPGVYRFRTPDHPYLLYVGEALRLMPRLRQHRQAADHLRGATKPAKRRSSQFDWRLGTQLSRNPGRIEVSWTSCATAADRKPLEADLIELHNVTVGRKPRWQSLVQLQPAEARRLGKARAKLWLARHPKLRPG